MTRYLSLADVALLLARAKARVQSRGPAFFAWRDAPMEGAADARAVFQAKLDGVYGERLVLSLALLPALVQAGHRVALLQVQKESTPFDATGWLVLSINGYPLFHIAPEDLPDVEPLVTLVVAGSPEAQEHAWKNTDKVDELTLLLDWVLRA